MRFKNAELLKSRVGIRFSVNFCLFEPSLEPPLEPVEVDVELPFLILMSDFPPKLASVTPLNRGYDELTQSPLWKNATAQ
ncbi:hypothetical protein SLA2020_233070 [Shorea laevis]